MTVTTTVVCVAQWCSG